MSRLATLTRAPRRSFALALSGAALAALAACGSGDGGLNADWLREPLEVALVPGDPPQVVYTVAVDSVDEHITQLRVATAGQELAFDVPAVSDANGNAPALPGVEVARAFWLWSPHALVAGDRTHALVIAEAADGSRQLQRSSWSDDPPEDPASVVSGSVDVVAFDAVACETDACVVLARATDTTSSQLVLTRFDAEGDRVGDSATLGRVDGVVRSVHVVRDEAGAALDVLALTCLGCGAVTWDAYEEDIYAVTSRIVHARVGTDGSGPTEPTVLFEWGGLVEPTSGAPWQDGAALLYWRTAATDAPACGPQGHCPIARDLVLGVWSRATGTFTESAPLATSELAYLQGLVAAGEQLWGLWRQTAADDTFLRELRLADLSDGADATAAGAQTLTRSYAPLLSRSDFSESPAALPFDFVDGLAALPAADPAADGPWIALRFRDLPAGGPEVCGEVVRAGVWSAQLTDDGLVGTASADRDSLWREADCGGGGACTSGGGRGRGDARGSADVLPALALVLVAALALRRRRQRG